MLRTIKSVQYKTSQTCGSHLRLLEGHKFAKANLGLLTFGDWLGKGEQEALLEANLEGF